METQFRKLSNDWNADPNAPVPQYKFTGDSLLVRFRPNKFKYPDFSRRNYLYLVFVGCSRFRFTPINDHAWYAGDCRFSKLAPEWGEFYQVDGDFREEQENTPWINKGPIIASSNNYLFYFRDETLECSALMWKLEKDEMPDGVFKDPFP